MIKKQDFELGLRFNFLQKIYCSFDVVGVSENEFLWSAFFDNTRQKITRTRQKLVKTRLKRQKLQKNLLKLAKTRQELAKPIQKLVKTRRQ